jgi:hypothetical protein
MRAAQYSFPAQSSSGDGDLTANSAGQNNKDKE